MEPAIAVALQPAQFVLISYWAAQKMMVMIRTAFYALIRLIATSLTLGTRQIFMLNGFI
jgi:hypothetical protein